MNPTARAGLLAVALVSVLVCSGIATLMIATSETPPGGKTAVPDRELRLKKVRQKNTYLGLGAGFWLRQFRDRDGQTHTDAFKAVVFLGDEVKPELVDIMLDDDHPFIREAALRALCHLQLGQEVLPAFRHVAQNDPDLNMRTRATDVVQHLEKIRR